MCKLCMFSKKIDIRKAFPTSHFKNHVLKDSSVTSYLDYNNVRSVIECCLSISPKSECKFEISCVVVPYLGQFIAVSVSTHRELVAIKPIAQSFNTNPILHASTYVRALRTYFIFLSRYSACCPFH